MDAGSLEALGDPQPIGTQTTTATRWSVSNLPMILTCFPSKCLFFCWIDAHLYDISLIYSKKKHVFFVFVSNFFSEVVGHLGDSRVILVKAGWIGGSWWIGWIGTLMSQLGMQKSLCPKWGETKKLEPTNLLSEEIGKVKSNPNLED